MRRGRQRRGLCSRLHKISPQRQDQQGNWQRRFVWQRKEPQINKTRLDHIMLGGKEVIALQPCLSPQTESHPLTLPIKYILSCQVWHGQLNFWNTRCDFNKQQWLNQETNLVYWCLTWFWRVCNCSFISSISNWGRLSLEKIVKK